MSIYETLSKVDVSSHIEKKNGLSYVSWAWAWHEIKKRYPAAYYTIYENADGWNYHTDGKTAWVKTGVTIDDLEHIEYLPVMDYKNKSIKVEDITSFDVNKTIQRSLTKACARHGLGLSVYASEDLPLDAEPKEDKPKETKPKAQKGTAAAKSTKAANTVTSADAAPTTPTVASVMQIEMIQRLCKKVGKSEDRICDAYQVKRIQDLTPELATEVINVLKNYEARM